LAKVASSEHVHNWRKSARWGRACGEDFNAAEYLKTNRQYDWLGEYLINRPAQTWELKGASDSG